MAQFFQPDPNDPTLTDAQGTPIDFQQYKALGGVGVEGQGGFTDVTPGSASATTSQLPSLNAPSANPMATFTKGLFDLMTRAQGVDSAKLLNERNRLAVSQAGQSQAPAAELGIEGLAPGAALAARGRQAQLFDPEIKNITDRIQASAQAVSKFGQTLKAAESFGETFLKHVTPSDETIQAVRLQMRAGVKPSEATLEKVGKHLTQDDWDAFAATKDKTTDQKEYAFAQSQGFTGTFQEWVDRQSRFKAGGDDGDGVDSAESIDAKTIRDTWRSGGFIQGNGTISSKDYKESKAWFVDRHGFGSAKDFDNEFIGFVDKSSPTWQQDYGITTTAGGGRGGTDNPFS